MDSDGVYSRTHVHMYFEESDMGTHQFCQFLIAKLSVQHSYSCPSVKCRMRVLQGKVKSPYTIGSIYIFLLLRNKLKKKV